MPLGDRVEYLLRECRSGLTTWMGGEGQHTPLLLDH